MKTCSLTKFASQLLGVAQNIHGKMGLKYLMKQGTLLSKAVVWVETEEKMIYN